MANHALGHAGDSLDEVLRQKTEADPIVGHYGILWMTQSAPHEPRR